MRQIVKEKSADIYAALLFGVSQHSSQSVHYQRDATQNNQCPSGHFRGIDHTHPTFVDQVDPDDDQRGVVDESGDHFDPLVPKCHTIICRATRDFARCKRDDKRGHVRKVVQRVRNERWSESHWPKWHLIRDLAAIWDSVGAAIIMWHWASLYVGGSASPARECSECARRECCGHGRSSSDG